MSMVTSATSSPRCFETDSACASWLPASKSHFPPSMSEVVVSPLQPRFSTASSDPSPASRPAVSAGYAVSRSSVPPGW